MIQDIVEVKNYIYVFKVTLIEQIVFNNRCYIDTDKRSGAKVNNICNADFCVEHPCFLIEYNIIIKNMNTFDIDHYMETNRVLT